MQLLTIALMTVSYRSDDDPSTLRTDVIEGGKQRLMSLVQYLVKCSAIHGVW